MLVGMHLLAMFFDGGILYNKVVFWISAIGSAATFLGMIAAVVQSTKALKSSKAARRASEATATRLSLISSLVDVGAMRSHCEQAESYLVKEDAGAAAIRISDLRKLVVIARSSQSASLLSPKKWQDLVTRIQGIHETLVDRSLSSDLRQRCLRELCLVNDELAKLWGAVAKKAGEDHVNTQEL